MAKPLKVWNGSAWVEVSLAIPSGYALLNSPTFTGTVSLPSTTSIGNVSNTEISYLDGVTSSIQTQLDSKATSATIDNEEILIIAGAW